MSRRFLLPLFLIPASGLVLALWGCSDPPPAPPVAEPLAETGTAFDPTTAGSIRGRVTWEGQPPSVPSFRAPVSPLSEQAGGAPHPWPNPHAPVIDPQTRGVGGAVVYLGGVQTSVARPWDLPPVVVEQRGLQLHVRQGSADGRVGFVRRGTAVTFTSTGQTFHSVQARGAAFFSLPFPQSSRPVERVLDRVGEVELSSGAGHFWMRAHLFVADHPYFTLTDAQGLFTLERVPPGHYEVVCWHPSWKEAEHELDGDTGLVCRLTFQPAATVRSAVDLAECGQEDVCFRMSAALFGR
jgi:hypothetical protein